MKARIIEGTGSNEVLLVIDFKMKVEPLYFREKNTDHYGKRGITWHGAMARFLSLESNDENDGLVAVENKVYFDHISAGDNKQDREAVIAYMEATILSIKRDLPNSTNITVQSDNATSYQNAFVAHMIHVLASAYSVNICRFIHTETQDGKSMLDAHFAQGMRKVKAWVQQGHDCYTPHQLVAALGADGGLFNSIAELVEYKREATADLHRQIAPMEKSFSKLIRRVNDLFYEYTQPEEVGNTNGNASTIVDSAKSSFCLNDSVNFCVRAFAYSGIGDGIHIVIDSQTLNCSLRKNTPRSFGWTATEIADQRASTQENLQEDGVLDMTSSTNHDESKVTAVDEEYLSDSDFSDSDESILGSKAIADEENTSVTVVGFVTGVEITTFGRMRRRAQPKVNERQTNALHPWNGEKPVRYEKNVVSYAKRSLLDMKHAGDLTVIASSELSYKLIEVGRRYAATCLLPIIFEQGWARRPPKGKMYGANYVAYYKDDIGELFQRGVDVLSNKLGPGRMLEIIQAKYPSRFAFPSISQLRAEISKLMKTRKESGQENNCDGESIHASGDSATPRVKPKRKRTVMDTTYAVFLKRLVDSNPFIVAKPAIEQFREAFPDSLAVEDSTIRNKVYVFKRQRTIKPA